MPDTFQHNPFDGDLIPPGGIAPFAYGLQQAGDEYHVLIGKWEAYPTEKPRTLIWKTTESNQRLISIPVYGGDNLEKASANQKQGDLCIVLPPDLPEEEPVRVAMTLDADGVFDTFAHLADGRSLRPLILKGEADSRAMANLLETMRRKKNELSPDEMTEAERIFCKAIDEIRGARYEQAVARVDELCKLIPTPVIARAEKSAIRRQPDDG